MQEQEQLRAGGIPKRGRGARAPPFQPHLRAGGLWGLAPARDSPGHREFPFLFDILRSQAPSRRISFCSHLKRESWVVLGRVACAPPGTVLAWPGE